jgi:hypothetical protein
MSKITDDTIIIRKNITIFTIIKIRITQPWYELGWTILVSPFVYRVCIDTHHPTLKCISETIGSG